MSCKDCLYNFGGECIRNNWKVENKKSKIGEAICDGFSKKNELKLKKLVKYVLEKDLAEAIKCWNAMAIKANADNLYLITKEELNSYKQEIHFTELQEKTLKSLKDNKYYCLINNKLAEVDPAKFINYDLLAEIIAAENISGRDAKEVIKRYEKRG